MRLLVLLFVLLLFGCQGAEDPSAPPTGNDIVERAIAAHGGAVLDRAVVSFQFRGDRYRLRQNAGRFHYRRTYTDSLGRTVHEGLTNNGLYRVVAGDTASLSADKRDAIETTVNSVRYFTLLPYPLQAPAAQPAYQGRDTVRGKPYHRIRVTFQKDGGGKDWEDVFLYWFDANTYEMDYLAYAFGLGPNEADAGTRFREAFNARRVHDVRFADYRNYTAPALSVDDMHRYPALLSSDSLTLVSRITIDNIDVRTLPPDS